MTLEDLKRAHNPDLYRSFEALKRAGQAARQKAIQTNTGIVVKRHGKTVFVTAEELRREADKQNPDYRESQ